MDDVAIRVENLSKTFKLPHEKHSSVKSLFVNFYKRKRTYEVQHALRDVSFEIKKGEFFGIVGRNGSGKSTLLKLMAGIYSPTRGEVKINGTLTPFIELGVGFNSELTGRENVYLNGALLGFNRREMKAMYNEIVEFAELEKFMDQKLKNFSSGMQVRLAFSIAIRAQGDILLLDEVLAVGDTAFQRKCLDFFREIKNTDRTVVLVTHGMSTIEEYCDRAMMLQDGKIVGLGDPMKISLQYEMANAVSAGTLDKPRPQIKTATIENVSISNGSEKTDQFILSDELQIEVELKVKTKQKLQISAALYNMKGEYVSGISSKKDLPDFEPAKGLHKLICTLAPGQFAKGAYKLNITVATNEDVPKLVDVANPDYGAGISLIKFIEKSHDKKGQFYVNAKWKHNKG